MDDRSAVRAGVRWAAVSAALAVLGAVVLVLAPLSGSTTVEGSPGGGVVTTTSTRTLLQAEGPSLLLVLVVPVGLALGGLATARRGGRGALTVLCVAYGLAVLAAAASVGLFFLPSVAALALARQRLGRRRVDPVGGELDRAMVSGSRRRGRSRG